MEQTTIRLVRRLALALALAVLWVVCGTATAAAQVDPDEDGDGIVDTLDQCNDTGEGDLIDAQGCSVCPCDATAAGNPWASHDAYVACVTDEAKLRRAAKTMKRREVRSVVRRARKATCGDEALTRCCVYAHLDDDAEVNFGQCRIMTVDACDEMSLRDDLDWVEDMDGGSCTPNPCQF